MCVLCDFTREIKYSFFFSIKDDCTIEERFPIMSAFLWIQYRFFGLSSLMFEQLSLRVLQMEVLARILGPKELTWLEKVRLRLQLLMSHLTEGIFEISTFKDLKIKYNSRLRPSWICGQLSWNPEPRRVNSLWGTFWDTFLVISTLVIVKFYFILAFFANPWAPPIMFSLKISTRVTLRGLTGGTTLLNT